MHHLEEAGYVGHGIETLAWRWEPLATSVIVALGGLLVGWLMYGRKTVTNERKDPLVKAFGPLHTFLQNKWYWDELYHTVFYRPTIWISEKLVPIFIDKGIIDGILHIIARVTYWIGHYAKRFEELVFGQAVDWVKDQFLVLAKETRQLQTGKIQEYLAVSGLIAAVFGFCLITLVNYGLFEKIQVWISQIF
jgi:NADH-quinone oxidoreductase subunit L